MKIPIPILMTVIAAIPISACTMAGNDSFDGGGHYNDSGSAWDASSNSWRFAFMGDNKAAEDVDPSGVNTYTVGLLAADMVSQNVSMVLAAGDLYDGRGKGVEGLKTQFWAWKQAMAPVYNAKIPVYAIPGNHEYWCSDAQACIDAWEQAVVPAMPPGIISNTNSYYPDGSDPDHTGREYSFAFKNVLFVGLDQNRFKSGGSYVRGNDLGWFSDQVNGWDRTSQRHLVAFGHMPQFSPRSYPQDSVNRDDFWDFFVGSGGKLYLTGHDHTYAWARATTKDGKRSAFQVISGAAGADMMTGWSGSYKESGRIADSENDMEHEGYTLVTVDGDTVYVEWRYYSTGRSAFQTHQEFKYTTGEK